jgi:DNA-binding LacI/PurR family transcriptional regulator
MPRNPTGRVKMSDIAQRAKVSRMAVSHVLMGTGVGSIRVSEKTTQRIRKIAQELGYTPNRVAQQLAGKRSGVIGILAHDWMHPFALQILAWMQHLADQRGFRVLAAQVNQSADRVQQYVADYASRGIDGLIFVAFGNDALWPLLPGVFAAIPQVVSVLGRPDFGPGCYVDADYAEGVRQAVTYLHRQGRRRIVQVLEDTESLMNRLRADASEQVHRELNRGGDPRPCSLVLKEAGPADLRYDRLADELINVRKADAVIANSDCGAWGLIHALYRRGLKVPDDVAVIGWGNEMGTPFADSGLTTVNFRFDEIISQVLDLLSALIENPDRQKISSALVPPQLMIRKTA